MITGAGAWMLTLRWTIRVLSSLKARPRGASHSASRALTWAACSWLWQSTTTSSAYLMAAGDARLVSPARMPEVT